MGSGVCKLTGRKGKYVKSHIIPKTLTYPGPEGLPFYQGGSGQHVKRRWDSWYDPELVTVEGEAILSDLDDWGTRFLRETRLVWSGWGPMVKLGSLHQTLPGTDWGIRQIEVKEPYRLRIFFLSLLWRAAASKLYEFKQVEISPRDLEELRRVILSGVTPSASFYPATLIQLSNLGEIHNHSPFADVKQIPGTGLYPGRSVPIFRFYFDGLITHFHCHAQDDGYTELLNNVMIGKRQLTVTTVSYEQSFQYNNLQLVRAETLG